MPLTTVAMTAPTTSVSNEKVVGGVVTSGPDIEVLLAAVKKATKHCRCYYYSDCLDDFSDPHKESSGAVEVDVPVHYRIRTNDGASRAHYATTAANPVKRSRDHIET